MPHRAEAVSFRMRGAAWALAASVALGCGGDGPGVPPPPCTFVLPSCPVEVPSFATAVGPVIAARCSKNCHRPGGIALTQPLISYPQVFMRRGAILGQVYRCKMPPADEPPLLPEEGGPLLDWLVCGAPDN
jgi:hypothetical protein